MAKRRNDNAEPRELDAEEIDRVSGAAGGSDARGTETINFVYPGARPSWDPQTPLFTGSDAKLLG